MLHRVIVTSIAGIAMLATSAPSATPRRALSKTLRAAGLCRNAPALAPLPPEMVPDQQQRPRAPYALAAPRPDGVVPSAVEPPLPSPPPPAPVFAPEPLSPAPMAMSAPPPPSGDVVVTGSRLSARRGGDKVVAEGISRLPDMSPRRPQPQPRAGTLTAGEHDDLLNPELYARYVAASNLGQRWRTLPLVDTGRALTIAVTDSAGQPVPLANVVLTCADGNTLSLATMADGTAVFFPTLDRLGGSVRVSVEGAALRRISIPQAAGPQRISITTRTRATAPTKFDLLLAVDTTGSMGDEITYLQAELRGVLAALKRSHPRLDLRVGLLFYRDVGDQYVTRQFAFTSDLARAQGDLRQQSASGGGDYPEAVDQAMNRAVHFGWRPDAVKSMLFVADAPPHDDLVGKTWAAAEVARAKRIQIVPVAASGVADEAEYVMRAMAAATQSRYLFLTDDSGIGNAHAAPAIDCYLVTRLDALIRRVLDSQISGRRIEPQRGEVIREVGQYDAGRCVLPRGR